MKITNEERDFLSDLLAAVGPERLAAHGIVPSDVNDETLVRSLVRKGVLRPDKFVAAGGGLALSYVLTRKGRRLALKLRAA